MTVQTAPQRQRQRPVLAALPAASRIAPFSESGG